MRWISLAAILAFTPVIANADPLLTAAQRHGVDVYLFQAVAKVESNTYPWTLNIDGEPLRFRSKDELLAYYRHVRKHPIMLRTVRGGYYRYSWYGTVRQAEQEYRSAKTEDERLGLRPDMRTKLRQVNPDNVDLGLMQINWREHGKYIRGGYETLIEPAANADYAAQHLAGLIRRYGIWGGVGRYHSPTSWRQQNYVGKVYRAYREIYSSAHRRASNRVLENPG